MTLRTSLLSATAMIAMPLLAHAGDISFAPVKTQVEALDDPQLRHRGMVFRDDERGWLHIGTPIKYRDEPGAPQLRWSAHGQDSEAIVAGLGFSDAERAAMRDAGVYATSTYADE